MGTDRAKAGRQLEGEKTKERSKRRRWLGALRLSPGQGRRSLCAHTELTVPHSVQQAGPSPRVLSLPETVTGERLSGGGRSQFLGVSDNCSLVCEK